MKRETLTGYRGKRSQAEMAKMYGVSQQMWSRWENGENKPSVVVMKKMELDSGIPMEILFFDVFNKKNLLKT
ncbi:helix-turn-helix transcriptional regulator [Mitsuokella sp. UBA4253]|uniref:helix-turn-helix transcriptional regulator n=1 Tax=Mitsuokella sp. UBA4253 TaxID=1946959 RepID=UPI00257D07A3|nr:helix-turn-helix transcriptional regulator [Mitsuokella sp. UBA4253]